MVYRTTPKMQKRKATRRRGLLDVATRLFGRRGYHGTTVPMVVSESGSSTGSFYNYFENKEDLFAQVLVSIGERLSAELNQAIAQADEPIGRMRAAVERLFLFLAANPAEARILLVESSGLGGRLAALQREILGSHARSVELAITAVKGRRSPGDPAILARCWVGAVYEAVRFWYELPTKKRPSPTEVANQVAAFNLRGIGR